MGTSRKIVFLDRDGVINKFPGNGSYVTKVKDLHLMKRSIQAIRNLTEAKCIIFVISNQAGVGKGVFSKQKLNQITAKLMGAVKKSGGKIKRVYYCIHRPDAGCTCRKPGIGNVGKALRAIHRSIIFKQNAFFVGDTKADIETGFNAGCTTIFVLSGRENRKFMRTWPIKPDYIAKDLFEATKIIVGEEDASHLHFSRQGPKIQV